MNELLAPFYYLCATDATPGAAEHAEADSFYCLVLLMGDFRDVFCQKLDETESGVKGTLRALAAAMQESDPEVARHLDEVCKARHGGGGSQWRNRPAGGWRAAAPFPQFLASAVRSANHIHLSSTLNHPAGVVPVLCLPVDHAAADAGVRAAGHPPPLGLDPLGQPRQAGARARGGEAAAERRWQLAAVAARRRR